MNTGNSHKILINGYEEAPVSDFELEGYRYGITKDQLLEIQERFRKQKEEYERKNKVFLDDERKKALYR